ncbi:YggS family pyridoxal phosphate-dependent enzyme [Brevundimonas sp.]|uniref:YggS family pyridoxal phosphate-dependent enzyme n=1 Tax=Brevundimonas sp. TaxID=1871086 RepID=UPI003D6D4875
MTASNPASAVPSIHDRFADVREHVRQACTEAGRDPASVTLTAVSKTQPLEALEAALATGQRVFGENRVQEAQSHWAARRAALPDLELRLIGPLQTNKAVEAVELFDVIETLDREKLAAALAAAMAKTGRRPRVLVQVNTGAEPQKAGVLPADADALIAAAREVHGLSVEGLMCIPPADEAPEPHFALLAEIAARNGLPVLSMGMSGDYETAIRLGATHVRVGSALFGERNRPLKPS